eukprot:13627619-Alexandrium_andersonii.AAC.1
MSSISGGGGGLPRRAMASRRGRCASTPSWLCPAGAARPSAGCWLQRVACSGAAAGRLDLPPGGPNGRRGAS